jgi:heavy metal sensor kinase
MNFWPRHVRSRLTLWYVGVLTVLLTLYAAGASLFLFLNLRRELDRNLLEDVASVEGLLASEPDGSVSLRTIRPEQDDPRLHWFVEVWSPTGLLLYRSPQLGGQVLGGPPKPGEGAHEPPPFSERLENGLRVRVASNIYHLEGHQVILRVALSEESLWRELHDFVGVLLLGFPLALLLAGFGGYALARRALAPLDAMTTQARRISAERLGERLPVENPEDELGKLASIFNAMLARLEAAFDQLRRFTADASHELRTPLTAIRSVGEVALQDQKSPSQYRDVIGSMLEETDRLTRLVEGLLLLSRADAGHIRLNRTEVSLLDLVREAGSLLDVLAEEKRQRVIIDGDPSLTVSVDRLILRQAFVNLIDNAIKYSSSGEQILVRVERGPEGQAAVHVVDHGPGVPAEHQSRIFDRFYRVDEARAREWGGAGLGLSIARWAVETHGGQVTLESTEGRGSTFEVKLPAWKSPPENENQGPCPNRDLSARPTARFDGEEERRSP